MSSAGIQQREREGVAGEISPNGYAEIFLNQFRIDGHLGSFRFPLL